MGQRVNIQYSVDISELDKEVERLITQSCDRLSNVLSEFPVSDEVLSVKGVESIDALRMEMAEIDYCLNDVNKLIVGFLSYKTSELAKNSPGDPPPGPTEEKSLAPEDFQEMLGRLAPKIPPTVQEALDEFKKSNEPA